MWLFKKMGLKEVSLTFGIAVLFALLVGFTIDAFYAAPEYIDFCQENFYGKPTPLYPNKDANCTYNFDDQFITNCTKQKGNVVYDYDKLGCQFIKGCDFCQVTFEEANKEYNTNLLWITAIVGLIAIFVGMYAPIYYDPIASGAIFGGILTLMYGTMRAFGNLSKIARVIILAVELGLLVWLGIRKVLNLPKKGKAAKSESGRTAGKKAKKKK